MPQGLGMRYSLSNPTPYVMPSSTLYSPIVDDARVEELYRQLRAILKELDNSLTDEEIEVALARTLILAQREKKNKFPPPKLEH